MKEDDRHDVLLTRDSIEAVMQEYDRGDTGFMQEYGFATNFDYVVFRPGAQERYPAKAIFLVAYSSIPGNPDIKVKGQRDTFRDAEGGPIHSEFRRLGYEVENRRQAKEKQVQADLIREHLIERYVDPARRRGDPTITIRAGDVHKELGLSNQMPNVCQVIEKKKFREIAGLGEPEIISGPASGQGGNMTYRFALADDLSAQMPISDEQLLARFDGNADFRARRPAWSSEQRAAFCKMARAVNAIGFDWYHTDIPQIRFGRKSSHGNRAEGTIGSLRFRTAGPFLRFSHQNELLGLVGDYQLNAEAAERFGAAMATAESSIRNWLPHSPQRPGKWPDDYRHSARDNSEGTAMKMPTNLILYGPPGTGKTYHTAREAVALCDGQADFPETEEGHTALMARYNTLVAEKRISFVTFHQSYGYEDFVEGLRPVPIVNSNGEPAGFHLQPESGVFRQIAERAETGELVVDSKPLSLADRAIYKMSLGEAANSAFDYVYTESIESDYALFGFSDIDWSDPRFGDRDEILAATKERFPDQDITPNKGLVQSPDVFRNQLEIGDVLIVSKGNNRFRAIGIVEGEYEYAPRPDGRYCHRRKVRWLWHDTNGLDVGELYSPKFIQKTIYRLKDSELNRPLIARLVSDASGQGAVGELLPHVLIIDEINRANVSKVFGELITLLEPDKRAGMDNALSVTLPYSKRSFSVPANLHIIGTMNTADRSIALLDTALRRRFRFREMAPEPSLLTESSQRTGIDLVGVLITINKRIEYLIDREHRIGHAFFIGCVTVEQVHAAMREKVIPLLQEYFFEDWSRVAAVLGHGFIREEKLDPPPGIEGDRLSSWSVPSPFQPDAFNRLLGKAAGAQEVESE
ncbi:AAA family ATPase [Mesorhizobium sp. M0496]|uniref:AAA family ATPase n=1 Tax=unclassified Mesorhizobium TaxID=325217 RepID=UPI00333B6DA5